MYELGWIENLSTRGEAKDKVGAFVCEVEEPSHLRGEKMILNTDRHQIILNRL